MAQLFLPWRTVTVGPVGAAPSPAGDDGAITGWQIYRLIRAVPGPGADLSVVMYTVLGAAVGGGALILLGLAMMMPINHRPLGLAALLISILLILGSCWMLVRARSIFDVGLSGLFDQAQIGWYLFLACGVLGVIGRAQGPDQRPDQDAERTPTGVPGPHGSGRQSRPSR